MLKSNQLSCIHTGEKIDNVERRLDEMNVDLKVTDKNIRELESFCGCCYCPCGKPRSVQVSCGFHSWRKQRGCVFI